MSTEPDPRRAKVYTDLSEFVVYLSKSRNGFALPEFRRWRAPDAIAGVGGFLLTIILTTVAAVIVLGRLPKFGPSGLTRLRWRLEARSPRTTATHLPASLAGRAVNPVTGRLTPLTRTGR